MSTQALKAATGLAPIDRKTRPLTFPELINSPRMREQIAAALPKHLNSDRMVRIALTEFRKNPDLGKCDPMTIVASIMVASQLGLEPGIMGQCYLIPYRDNKAGKHICTFIPGWQGMVDLVSRSGRATVRTGVVLPGDNFAYDMGTEVRIAHRVTEKTDYDSEWTHVYAIGRVKGAEEPIIEVWTRKQVQSHLKRYNKVGDRHYAKQGDYNLQMYGRKAALLQVIKYLPKSVELVQAAALEYSAESGSQMLNVDDVAAGVFDASGSYPEGQVLEGGADRDPDPKELLAREAGSILRLSEDAFQAQLAECGGDYKELGSRLSALVDTKGDTE